MGAEMGAVAMSVGLVVLALVTTVTLLYLAMATGIPSESHEAPGQRATTRPSPGQRATSPRPSPAQRATTTRPTPERRLRLLSRALFASRTPDTITLDCTLVRAEELDVPPYLAPPVGLPFTLQLRPPEASWFAGRVEELLREWAEENRELVLELREDRGRVRTTIASGDSSVYLELADAAGFGVQS